MAQDIYCVKCGEPVEVAYLHDVAAEKRFTFQKVLKDFQTRGCKAILSECNEPDTSTDNRYGITRMEAQSALFDLLGDDVDGAAAMMEDFGL